jgi:hypothetical protein
MGRDTYINVPYNPTAATVNAVWNTGSGLTAPFVTTQPGFNLPYYSGSYNIAQSQGTIEFHNLKIEQVNPSTGSTIATVYPSTNTPISGSVSTLTGIALNSINVPANATLGWAGGTGFFANSGNQNKAYKLTAGVGNVCGTSTSFSYFNPNVAGRFGIGVDNEVSAQAAYPNPFQDFTTITIPLEAGEEIQGFDLYDINGTKVKNSNAISESMVNVEASELATGTYVYSCLTNFGTYQGKIIKN